MKDDKKVHYVFAGHYIGCGLYGAKWQTSEYAGDVTCLSCRRSIPFSNARAGKSRLTIAQTPPTTPEDQ